MTPADLKALEHDMQRRLAAMPKRVRPFTTEAATPPRNTLVIGPRGCGKSTFLLYHARGRKMLYFSADNPMLASDSLYQLVSEIFMAGYEGVIIDEVHYLNNWSLHLKALCDSYPQNTVWASDSSALVLRAGNADLSRRYVTIRMPLMSFREYLFLETGASYPIYHLGDDTLPAQPDPALLNHFHNYRQHGTRPFYQEGDFDSRYIGTLNKILDTDIPFFTTALTANNLRLMRAVVGTLARSSVPRVQVTSLCNDWGVGAEKLYQMLFVMEEVELLRIIRLQNDNKARSVGAKMLFADPCAYHVLNADMGTEREAFVACCFAQAGYTVEALRNERQGDFIVTPAANFGVGATSTTLEVGGEKKKPKDADYTVRDNTDYPVTKGLPFWLLAMMW